MRSTRLSFRTTRSLLGVAFFTLSAQATLITLHQGAANPTTEGFYAYGAGGGIALIPDGSMGLNRKRG